MNTIDYATAILLGFILNKAYHNYINTLRASLTPEEREALLRPHVAPERFADLVMLPASEINEVVGHVAYETVITALMAATAAERQRFLSALSPASVAILEEDMANRTGVDPDAAVQAQQELVDAYRDLRFNEAPTNDGDC
jgi:flagellar motor switch protein FliG